MVDSKKIYIRKIIYVLILFLLTILVSLPAFRGKVALGHDLPFHFGRIDSLANAIKTGQLPARFESEAWYSYGYVSSTFYGHLLLYIPACLRLFGMPVFMAYNCYVIFINMLTALISYYSFKRILKNDSRFGVFATTIYMVAGYRLSNLFVRAAVGEYTAMAFLPLFMLGIYQIYYVNDYSFLPHKTTSDGENHNRFREKLNYKEKVNILELSRGLLNFPLILGATGIIESHILTTELVMLFTLIFAILSIKKTISVIIPLLSNLLVVLGLNLYFILPFISSYSSMNLNINSPKELEDLSKNGLYLRQIFGPLVGGHGSNFEWTYQGEEYLNFGIVLIICMLSALVIFIIDILKKSINTKVLKLGFLGVLALWFSTIYFPWQLFTKDNAISKLMTSVQYPWRYMMLATLIFTVIGAYSIMYLADLVAENKKKFCTVVKIHKKGETTYGVYVNKVFLIHFCILIMLAVVSTAYFDYMLVCTNPSVSDESASANWADKLYLPVGTSIDGISDNQLPVVDYEKGEVLLPVFAYNNVKVYDVASHELPTSVGANNQLMIKIDAFSQDISSENEALEYAKTLKTKFVEPVSWRVAELVSIVFLLCLIIISRRRTTI